jgi:hypothetical protein
MSHARGNIFFGERAEDRLTFSEAFPEILDASAEVEETGEGNHGLGLRRFHKQGLREYINCSNHRCLGKGFALGFYLREMIRAHASERAIDCPCESHDEDGHPCGNRFKAQIKIQYR